MEKNNNFAKRLIMSILGIGICSVSVALFKLSNLGVDPFQSMAMGTHSFVSLSYGTYYLLLSILFLIVTFILDKHYISLATFLNMFLMGYIIDFSIAFFKRFDFIANATMSTRAVLLILGIVIMCFGSALYYTGDLGVSVYDAIALVMADRKIAKFQYCRIGADLVCVTIGFVTSMIGNAGPLVGIGTVITAFFMGPLIEFFNVHIARPLLYGRDYKKEEARVA